MIFTGSSCSQPGFRRSNIPSQMPLRRTYASDNLREQLPPVDCTPPQTSTTNAKPLVKPPLSSFPHNRSPVLQRFSSHGRPLLPRSSTLHRKVLLSRMSKNPGGREYLQALKKELTVSVENTLEMEQATEKEHTTGLH
jgi:hypothetical protein